MTLVRNMKKTDEPNGSAAASSSSSAAHKTLDMHPAISLDFMDWGEDDVVLAPKEETITDPVLCQLHVFMGKVEAQARTIAQTSRRPLEKILASPARELFDAVPMLDWSSPAVRALTRASTDAEVVRLLQRGHYLMVRTLFWMQSHMDRCLTQLHLMRDIIGSTHWTAVFCEVMNHLRARRSISTQGMDQHVALRMWIRDQAAGPRDDASPARIASFAIPGPMPAPPDFFLALVRDMTDLPDLNAEQVALTEDQVCRRRLNGDAATLLPRMRTVLHAQFVLARLVASQHVPASATAARAAFASTLWLRNFLAHGCNCSS